MKAHSLEHQRQSLGLSHAAATATHVFFGKSRCKSLAHLHPVLWASLNIASIHPCFKCHVFAGSDVPFDALGVQGHVGRSTIFSSSARKNKCTCEKMMKIFGWEKHTQIYVGFSAKSLDQKTLQGICRTTHPNTHTWGHQKIDSKASHPKPSPNKASMVQALQDFQVKLPRCFPCRYQLLLHFRCYVKMRQLRCMVKQLGDWKLGSLGFDSGVLWIPKKESLWMCWRDM